MKSFSLHKNFNINGKFQLDDSVFSELVTVKHGQILLSVPLLGIEKQLELKRNFLSNGNTKRTTDTVGVIFEDTGVHYGGKVVGSENSFVAISFSEFGIYGIIEDNFEEFGFDKNEDGTYSITKVIDDGEGWTCNTHSNPSDIERIESLYKNENLLTSSSTTKCVNVRWDVENNVITTFGGLPQANAWITALFNASQQLYLNEGIQIYLQTLNFFTSGPSGLFSTSTTTGLQLYTTYRVNSNDIIEDTGQYLSFGSTGGSGQANGIGTMCTKGNNGPNDNRTGRYSYTLMRNSNSGITPSSTVYSRTVKVVTHEQGHVFGSYHSFGCYWNNTWVYGQSTFGSERLDGTSCGEGTCFCPPPPTGATIMSYGDSTGSAPIVFSLGFGPVPRQRIIDFINNTFTCITCSGAPIDQTPTNTPTVTPTPPNTPTVTPTPTITKTPFLSPDPTTTPTITPTITKTQTPTLTRTKTNTPTQTVTKTNTPTQTKTQTLTKTVTPSNNDPCSNCLDQHPCPTLTPTPTTTQLCDTYITTPSTNPLFDVPLVKINNAGYTNIGTRFYNNGFQFGGSGSTYYFSNTTDVWKNTDSTNGPLNRSGVWSLGSFPANTWLGFSVCINVTGSPKTFYVGFGADNAFRLNVDGIETINTTLGGYNNSTLAFSNWHVYPITLNPGDHVVLVYGLNLTQTTSGVFGCEIYDNTFNQLTGATLPNDLNVIFSSSFFSESNAQIVQSSTGLQLNSGYTCPLGYIYQSCQDNCFKYIFCPQTTQTPTPTNTITPELSPNPTPSQTQTMTVTPSQTQTPTKTPQTPTPTPTNTSTKTPTPTNTLTKSSTPTPTKTIPVSVQECTNTVFPNPQTTINGITITANRTGNTVILTSPPLDDAPICNTSVSIQYPAILLGSGLNGITQTGPPNFFSNWTLSLDFSQSITSITIALKGGGCNCIYSPNDPENFWFTTNVGLPTISPIISCNSIINNNEIILNSVNNQTGDGIFTITNCNGFTNLTLTGNGGYSGTYLAICDTSISTNPCITPTPTPTITSTPLPECDFVVTEQASNPKKGIYLDESIYGQEQLLLVNVSWFYNQSLSTTNTLPIFEFVPMVYSLNEIPYITYVNTLLGFYEPDNPSESNISVNNAVSNWQYLYNNSNRTGSPVTSGNALVVGGWFNNFMNSTI